MERTGEVTAVHGEFLEITFCRPSECEHCHACMGGETQRKLVVKGQANIGDAAVVEMAVKSMVKASAIAYVFPLLALLIGMFGGMSLFPQNQDVAALIGGAILMGASLLVIKLTEKKRAQDKEWQPTLVRIVPLNRPAAE